MTRTITIVTVFLLLPLVGHTNNKTRAKDLDAVEALLRENKEKEVRALGDKAIPALAELFKGRKYPGCNIVFPVMSKPGKLCRLCRKVQECGFCGRLVAKRNPALRA